MNFAWRVHCLPWFEFWLCHAAYEVVSYYTYSMSWRERCAVLLRARAQYTWVVARIRRALQRHMKLKSRSFVLVSCDAFWDGINTTLILHFALLTSPSLNPFFARIMDGLLTAWRSLWATGRFLAIKQQIYYDESAQLRDRPLPDWNKLVSSALSILWFALLLRRKPFGWTLYVTTGDSTNLLEWLGCAHMVFSGNPLCT